MGRPLQHRRRIKIALVAGLAIDVGFALVTTGVASAAPSSATRAPASSAAATKAKAFATLKILKANVSVRRKGKSAFTPAHDGQKLRVGDTIQTDAGGEAEIDYTESSFTRLDVSTTFTLKHLTDNQGHRQVEGSLDTGRTWNRTTALTQSESFSQDGAGATASVVGSAFMAECDTAGHCTFTSVVDGLKLVTVDGEVKLLTPLEGCDSTEVDPTNANLCGVPTQITADILAANAWIMQNLFVDGKAGFPGPTITGTIVVNNGVVTFTPTPPPASSPPADNPPTSTAPGAPTGAHATAGDGSATVSWSAPASDGGSAITGYTVTGAPGGTCTPPGAATSCVVHGLTNGTPYTFTVTATNGVGTGPASDPSNSVTPLAPPAFDANVVNVGSTPSTVTTPATGISAEDEVTTYFQVNVSKADTLQFTALPTNGLVCAPLGANTSTNSCNANPSEAGPVSGYEAIVDSPSALYNTATTFDPSTTFAFAPDNLEGGSSNTTNSSATVAATNAGGTTSDGIPVEDVGS